MRKFEDGLLVAVLLVGNLSAEPSGRFGDLFDVRHMFDNSFSDLSLKPFQSLIRRYEFQVLRRKLGRLRWCCARAPLCGILHHRQHGHSIEQFLELVNHADITGWAIAAQMGPDQEVAAESGHSEARSI